MWKYQKFPTEGCVHFSERNVWSCCHVCRDGPNSTKNPWGAGGRLTHTTWESIGLPSSTDSAGGYTAKDVFTQEKLFANESGFTANISGYNATLVLVQAA